MARGNKKAVTEKQQRKQFGHEKPVFSMNLRHVLECKNGNMLPTALHLRSKHPMQ
jgi:hypothetical protein